MLKEIYFYNKEEKSEVLGDYLHTSEELEKIGKNYILVIESEDEEENE